MPKTIGELMKKLTNKKPVPFDGFGEPGWLHPVGFVDFMVVEAQLDELARKLKEKNLSDDVKSMIISKAIAAGTVQLALRKEEKSDSPLVFESFELAYRFMNTPEFVEKMFDAHGVYVENFDLLDQEKKV